ncbi:MAG: hypothetical protein ACRD0C_00915 [Acidimicrobiia bacterium]
MARGKKAALVAGARSVTLIVVLFGLVLIPVTEAPARETPVAEASVPAPAPTTPRPLVINICTDPIALGGACTPPAPPNPEWYGSSWDGSNWYGLSWPAFWE